MFQAVINRYLVIYNLFYKKIILRAWYNELCSIKKCSEVAGYVINKNSSMQII